MAAAKKSPSEAVLKRIRTHLAVAADASATPEERRTHAEMAAKLIKQHDIAIGEPSSAPPVDPRQKPLPFTSAVAGAVSAAREGLGQALGFDVVGFAQGLIRDRARTELERVIKAPVARTELERVIKAPVPRRRAKRRA